MLKNLFTYFILIFAIQLATSSMPILAATANSAQEGEDDEYDEEDEDEEEEEEEEGEQEGDEETEEGDEGSSSEDQEEEDEIEVQPQTVQQPKEVKPLTLKTPDVDMIITSKVYEPKNIVYKKRYWREIDFGILPNAGYFFREHEIMKYIIRGIEAGKVKVYTSYAKDEEMTLDQFKEQLKIPMQAQQEDDDDEWEISEGESQDESPKEPKADYFMPRELQLIEIEEDVCFDKQFYEWYHNIRSVKIIVPKSKFATGVRKEVCVLDFKELVDYLDTEPEALWRNHVNSAANKKISVALKERMFSSLIVKVENPNDDSVADMYKVEDDYSKVYASLEEERKLAQLKKSIYQY